MLNQITTGFIGAGNMATALIRGLLANGVDPARIVATDSDQGKLQALQKDCGIGISDSNAALVDAADVVVLAVKPQVMAQVLKPLAANLAGKKCLLVSVAAGITLESLQAWTHKDQAIVRCMPNTPALVQCGASALFANRQSTDEQKQQAQAILEAVGIALWLSQEQQMDAVTALSGSGPAYFFLLMEAMQSAALKLGLGAEVAEQLCLQTALGSAKLAHSSDVDVAELRHRVTSPGGTTEAAIEQFLSEDFLGMVARALDRAATRSEALARNSASDTKNST